MKLLTTALFALSLFAAPGVFADDNSGHTCNCTKKCAHHAKNETGAGHSCTGECEGCAEGKCNDKACAGDHHHDHHHHHGAQKASKKG